MRTLKENYKFPV